MVYRFTIISDEVDNFIREIKIDSEATFFDFHMAILAATGYKDDQMTSFFLCDESWEKEKEVTLEDMGSSSDEDCWLMRKTRLSELIEEERQRLLYVFDPLADRVFFIELTEIITGQTLKKAICSRQKGEAPKQTVDFDEALNADGSLDLDENFYGDQDFDLDEFDPDGFEMSEGSSDYDDDRY